MKNHVWLCALITFYAFSIVLCFSESDNDREMHRILDNKYVTWPDYNLKANRFESQNKKIIKTELNYIADMTLNEYNSTEELLAIDEKIEIAIINVHVNKKDVSIEYFLSIDSDDYQVYSKTSTVLPTGPALATQTTVRVLNQTGHHDNFTVKDAHFAHHYELCVEIAGLEKCDNIVLEKALFKEKRNIKVKGLVSAHGIEVGTMTSLLAGQALITFNMRPLGNLIQNCTIISGTIFSSDNSTLSYDLNSGLFQRHDQPVIIGQDAWRVNAVLTSRECSFGRSFLLGNNVAFGDAFNRRLMQDAYSTATFLICLTNNSCFFSKNYQLTYIELDFQDSALYVIVCAISGCLFVLIFTLSTFKMLVIFNFIKARIKSGGSAVPYLNKPLSVSNKTKASHINELNSQNVQRILNLGYGDSAVSLNSEKVTAMIKKKATQLKPIGGRPISGSSQLPLNDDGISPAVTTRPSTNHNSKSTSSPNNKASGSKVNSKLNSKANSKPSSVTEKNSPLKDSNLDFKSNSIHNLMSESLVNSDKSAGTSVRASESTPVAIHIPDPDEDVPDLIPVNAINSYLYDITGKGYNDFLPRWNDMMMIRPDIMIEGLKPENKPKNRYGNIFPGDRDRVILEMCNNDETSKYINATFIDGFNTKNEYIACQGPKDNTVSDFWRMVYEQKVYTIVMLGNWVESGRTKVNYYLPEQNAPIILKLANRNFMSVSVHSTVHRTNLIGTKLTVSVFQHQGRISRFSLEESQQNNAALEEYTVVHLMYRSWPDHSVPNDMQSLLALRKTANATRNYLIRKQSPDKDRHTHPLVVHCSAGVGRTGTFILYDYNMKRVELGRKQTINIDDYIIKMRERRPFMVQTTDQYFFVLSLLEYSLVPTTSENISLEDFKKQVDNVFRSNPSTLMKSFEKIEKYKFDTLLKVYNNSRLCQENKEILLDGKPLTFDMCYIDSVFDENVYYNCINPECNLHDFLMFLHAHDIECVVQLCDENLEPQYRDGVQLSDRLRLTAQKVDVFGGTTVTTLLLEKDGQRKHIKHYNYRNWAQESAENLSSSAVDFVKRVRRELKNKKSSKCLFHSPNPLLYCAQILFAILVLDDFEAGAHKINIMEIIGILRRSRKYMIPTSEEFTKAIALVDRLIDPQYDRKMPH